MTVSNMARWIGTAALVAAVSTDANAVVRVTIQPVTRQTAGPSDTAATLPTAQTQFVPGETFVVELWAQTTQTSGLSSVTVDLSFLNTVVTAQSITHAALFNASGLSTGTINNPGGLIDDLGGSHAAASPPCSDQVGLTNWARVAIVDMQALANGASVIQSADTASLILGTAICNEFGNVVPADIDFGQVAVTVEECFDAGDCDDAQFCNGPEQCVGNVCQAGTAPSCVDADVCTDDLCDPAANLGAGACNNPNNTATCDDGQFCTENDTCSGGACSGTAFLPPSCVDADICTDDLCDPAANLGAGACVNTANDANCVDSQFCNGSETCDPTNGAADANGCVAGPPVCTASCEHCDELGDTCELCILDLDVNGVMGTGDFALFAACFDGCYLETDPCAASNFDGDSGVCVGTGDYSGFVGCFGEACGDCANCAGPPPTTIASLSYATESVAAISLVTVRRPTPDDFQPALPPSETSFKVGQRFFVEVWATRPATAGWSAEGLASVFVDLSFDAKALAVERVISGHPMSTFADGVIHPELGRVSRLGGCSKLDSPDLGANGNWVRVATLAVRTVATGSVNLTAGPSDPLHGVSIVNELGNLDPFLVDFGAASVNIVMKPMVRDVPHHAKN